MEFLGVVIVIFIIYYFYRFFSDREEMLKRQVDDYGGMRNKYAILIAGLVGDDKRADIYVRRDYVHVTYGYGMYSWHIQENFNKVEIDLALADKTLRKWTFSHNMSQIIILDTLLRDMGNENIIIY